MRPLYIHVRNTNDQKKKWIRIPYRGNLSIALSHLFLRIPIVAYYAVNTVKQFVSKLKDSLLLLRRSKFINCCVKTAPPNTWGRRVGKKTRQPYRPKTPQMSSFAAHLLESGHIFMNNDFHLEREENDLKERSALETIEESGEQLFSCQWRR